MSVEYVVWLSSPRGERLAVLDDFVRLDYRRRVNQDGYLRGFFGFVSFPLTLTLPYPTADRRWLLGLLQRDYRLEVWRSVSGGLLELDTETVWFIRRVARRVTDAGAWVVEVQAEPAVALLLRRIVAYVMGSSEAEKSGAADDLMKAIVRENFGASADADRQFPSGLFQVEADRSAGAAVDLAFQWRNVLAVLEDLAEASAEGGVPLFFDVAAVTPDLLEFRTYPTARGADHRFGNAAGLAPVVLSVETGTLANVERWRDWSEEVTQVYVAGQGSRAAREVVEVGDASRSGAVPFGRVEVLRDARHVAVTEGLTAEGEARLRQGLPANGFLGSVVSREPWAVYGLHWRFGDLVSAEFDGEIVSCRVNGVHVVVEREGDRLLDQVEAELGAVDGLLVSGVVGGAAARSSSVSSVSSAVADGAAQETEHVFQQVQGQGVPEGEYVYVPADSSVVVHGEYRVLGTLQLVGELRVYE